MQIEDLKEAIESESVELPLILIKTDDTSEIIMKQYIEEIARQKELTITFVDSLQQEDLFGQELYVIRNLAEKPTNNTIVICDKAREGIKIPKLEDWQLSQYIKENIVNSDKIDSLVKNCISKMALLNELEKLLVFPKNKRAEILEYLDFTWLMSYSEFDVSNALCERKKTIDLDRDINPLAIQTLVYNNLKLTLRLLTDPNATAEKLGISEKRFYYMKNHCNYYKVEEIIKILKELSSLELKYKLKGLPYKNLLEYITIICLNGGC